MSKNFWTLSNRLLEDRFGQRLDMIDITEQSVLLDAVFHGIYKSGMMDDIVLKGGSALQRCYFSERFSADADFCCGRVPKFSEKEFVEYGEDFLSAFIRTLRETYEIPERNITVEKPVSGILFGDERDVAKWTIRTRIPDHLSLLTREARNARRNRPHRLEQADVQYIKIEICNVDAYNNFSGKICAATDDESFEAFGRFEHLDEIFCDKILSLLSRRTFKHSDAYDLFFAETYCGADITDIPRELLLQKMRDQGLHEKIIRERMKKNLSFVENTRKNRADMTQHLSLQLSSSGYREYLEQMNFLIEYAKNRMEFFGNHFGMFTDVKPLDISENTNLKDWKTENLRHIVEENGNLKENPVL